MAVALVTSNTFAFADGGSGHSCNLGSSPAVGDLDVLCVNSDTTVSTPSGFTSRRSDVTNQGAYIFSRKATGGEASTVTVTTTGSFNAIVSWSRWSGTNSFDVSAGTQANSSATSSSPTHSSGTLAGTNELVVAFAAMHSGIAAQNTPVWSGGFTGLTEALQGSGSSGCLAFVGYRTDAGTAAVSPAVSWSGGTASDRYMLTAAFTAAAGGTTFPQSLAGGITPTGAVTRRAGKVLGGSVTPAGAVRRLIAKTTSGGITPAGVVSTVKAVLRTFTGTVTPAGTLTRRVGRTVAGSLTPTGTVTRSLARSLAGSITPAGVLGTVKAALRTFTGGITPTGTVRRQVGKAVAGTVTPSGSLRRSLARTVGGTLATAGSLARQVAKRFTGGVTPAGSVATQALGPPDNIVHRPFTGTTTRPDTGIVHRPFTGTVTRP